MYVVPFHRFEHFAGYEASAGFYPSAALVRKIALARPDLSRGIAAEEAVDTLYPA